MSVNEILQWVCIALLAAVIIVPPAIRIWRDFKEEEAE